jgi:hypothetical protein
MSRREDVLNFPDPERLMHCAIHYALKMAQDGPMALEAGLRLASIAVELVELVDRGEKAKTRIRVLEGRRASAGRRYAANPDKWLSGQKRWRARKRAEALALLSIALGGLS